jgi:hypothetical protein
MPTNSRRRPSKPAAPLDLDEIEQDPGFRGMLSFLEVPQEEKLRQLALRNEADGELPMGQIPMGGAARVQPPAVELPVVRSPGSESLVGELPAGESPIGELGLGELSMGELSMGGLNGRRPNLAEGVVGESRPSEGALARLACDSSFDLSEPLEGKCTEARGMLPETLPEAEAPAGQTDMGYTPMGCSPMDQLLVPQSPLAQPPLGELAISEISRGHLRPEPPAIPRMDVEGRGKRPLRYCRTVQDGHTSSEELAYQALWLYARRHGQTDSDGSQMVDLALSQLRIILHTDHKNVKRLLTSLQSKLVLEVVRQPDYRRAICTRYKIFNHSQILERRNRASMLWVVRTRAVRFVPMEVVNRLLSEEPPMGEWLMGE